LLQVAQFTPKQLSHWAFPPLEYIGGTQAVQVPSESYPKVGGQLKHIVPSALQVWQLVAVQLEHDAVIPPGEN